jgi:hypothetical protein
VRGTAREVLEGNDRGDHTIAAPGVYPYQWLWDAGFVALGWATVDTARAWLELETLFAGQAPDGFLPHVLAHHAPHGRFPEPDLWGRPGDPATSGITQPPILASVVLRLLEHSGGGEGEAAARRLWPRLVAFHRWLHDRRDPAGAGLVASLHPWETGMDDSPAWDGPLARVAARSGPGPPAADRPATDAYPRYLALVAELREAGYDSPALVQRASFRVADACTNAVLARADADLVRLGRRLGARADDLSATADWARRSAAGLASLWDEDAGHFLSRDLVTGAPIPCATAASFLGLWSGAATAPQVQRLVDHLGRWGQGLRLLASCDPDSPAFDPGRFWRGPVWVNVNWMVAEGLREHGEGDLAERVALETRSLIEGAGMREHFHASTGAGLGATDFSWTAALARWWLALD